MKIQIGNRTVGPGFVPFIVAEAGVNHNGSLEKALEMVRVAKEAGADAIKFQTFKAEEFVADPKATYTYRSQGKEVTESMLEMFKRHEFSPEQWRRIKDRSDELGITFLSTPQNRSDLDLLLSLGITAIKIGSDDFTNTPLVRDYASARLPMILSCGMADLAEVKQTLEAAGAPHGAPVILLVCTSQYPTPPADTNLLRMKTLAAEFPEVVMGFSDHTQGPLASSLAVALGACLIEKHFTLSHDLPGPDHWFSEDPASLKEWVHSIRRSYTMLGDGVVQPTSAEREMKLVARRSVVALQDIAPNETLNPRNVGLKRPGTGLPASAYDKVIGTRATRAIQKGAFLTPEDFK